MRYFKENKSRLAPIIVVVALAILTLLSVSLTKKQQELRSKALSDTAVLSFAPTTISVAPNNSFNVSVILNTGNQAVVGNDIIVQFDRTKLTLQNIALPSPLNNTFRTYAPITTGGAFDISTVVTNANITGQVEFGAISFDYATQTLTPPFNGVVSPLATLTFFARAGASGSDTLRFRYDSATSTTDSNVIADPATSGGVPEDILVAPTSTVAVTFTGASPTPVPSATPVPTPTPTPSGTPRPTATPSPGAPTPTPSPLPTPSGSPTTASIILQVQLEGVTVQRPDKTATVTLRQGSTVVRTTTVTMSANAAGIYSTTPITNVTPGTYDILVKGPAHLTRLFSNQTINSGTNTKNLTALLLLTGDIFPNDRIDIFDYSQLVADFGPRMPTAGSLADFDLDGDVDIFDYSFLVGNFNKTGDQ